MRTFFLKPTFWFAALLLATGGAALSIPQPAQAQCGSSASSCKSCHETQGQIPVNTQGEWHTQHAFGDFCEFCHAGNVQATDMAAAHQGLVEPLEDVVASCQGCHPQDTAEHSQQYAAILGVTLDSGGASPSGGAPDDTSPGDTWDASSAPASAQAVEAECVAPSGVVPPLGGEEIDFRLLYAEKTVPLPLIHNWGNVILLVLLFGLGAAFFFTAWAWEGWGPIVARWLFGDRHKIVHYTPNTTPTAPELDALFRRKPALAELWPKLAGSKSTLLQDLLRLLDNEEQGARLVRAASRLDLNLAAALKQLDEQERALLLAVVKEM